MRKALVMMLVSTALMAGCVPYPVYKKLQPAAMVTVRTAGNVPLAGAEVALITRAHPTTLERHDTKMTAADGSASFAGKREMTVEVMVIHGSLDYYWNWCVRKEGYATFKTIYNSSDDFPAKMNVVLQPGASTPCRVSEIGFAPVNK
jgi:hypothetical protein